jgi:homoserine kinase type II
VALFTRLERRDFEALAEGLCLGDVVAWQGLEAGTVNSNYFLETAHGHFFVRVTEGKSRGDVDYENELVAHLAERGVTTPAARLFVDEAGRLISVFARVDGAHRQGAALEPGDLAEVGGALAALHRAGASFDGRRESIYTFERIVERRRGIPAQPPGPLADALADCDDEIAWLSEPPRAAARAALPRGVIHGDLFPDNVLFRDGRVKALLDFEQASDGALIYDLAVCLCAWCFGEDAFRAPLAAALVGAYRKARPLEPAEDQMFYTVARQAALRFTITRITDVELNPAAAARRESKSYRRFHARLLALRAMGEAGFRDLVGGLLAARLDH